MAGFKSEALNVAFADGAISVIISHLAKCSRQMKADCASYNDMLENNEDIITNRIASKYLNAEPNDFRYMVQCSENFDETTGRHVGRTDITVVSSDYFRDSQAYHIIECKRVDGSSKLNNKYIIDGVNRFLNPTPKPKYSSFYKQNLMFGYVVQAIDIPENTAKINDIQNQILGNIVAGSFLLTHNEGSEYFVYSCQYHSVERTIELRHLFYDFSMVIQN